MEYLLDRETVGRAEVFGAMERGDCLFDVGDFWPLRGVKYGQNGTSQNRYDSYNGTPRTGWRGT